LDERAGNANEAVAAQARDEPVAPEVETAGEDDDERLRKKNKKHKKKAQS